MSVVDPVPAGDPFDLARFVDAQNPVFDRVMDELRGGAKRSHWMWFVFPQLAGLGSSPVAQRFAIGSLDEAKAYLAHPLLGSRLHQATAAVLAIQGRALSAIFGTPDDLKFRSSMTLFERIGMDKAAFSEALDRFCQGQRDTRTLSLLG